MGNIDWLGTSLQHFSLKPERQADGTDSLRAWPYGEGEAQRLMVGLAAYVEDVYAKLVSPEDFARVEATGEVPVIRGGLRGYEPLESLKISPRYWTRSWR